jgi:2-succinyl-6-hydroxy-2,4-cyclohexadiene-1-carboxylate synthase
LGQYSADELNNLPGLNYWIWGDRHLPVMIWLHGFLGSHQDFVTIATHLSGQFCSVAIDLPGHGASLIEADDWYAMARTATLVVAVMHRLQISTAGLYGYSMGGRLALYLAIHYPERFTTIRLESASPGLRSVAEQVRRRQQDDQLADRLAPDWPQFLADWYAQPLFASLSQHPQFAALLTARSPQNPRFLAKSLRHMGLGSQPNLWPQLAQLSMPVRLLVGEHDRKFRMIQTEMANCAQSATINVVENTGHNIHFENPAAIIREISSFDRLS